MYGRRQLFLVSSLDQLAFATLLVTYLCFRLCTSWLTLDTPRNLIKAVSVLRLLAPCSIWPQNCSWAKRTLLRVTWISAYFTYWKTKIVCCDLLKIVTFAFRYNYSVDYWSLGLVSHEVITGVRPFLPNMTPAAWYVHGRMYVLKWQWVRTKLLCYFELDFHFSFLLCIPKWFSLFQRWNLLI
jgi:hypothetical protein